MAVGDVNGDGKQDLALANFGGPSVSVLLGNGDGNFQLKQTVGLTTTLTAIAIADLNGNGIPDLAVTSVDGTVSVLLGNGDGTFQTMMPSVDIGNGPTSVAIADLNGDGIPDLAVTLADTIGDSAVSVLWGKGDGTFSTQLSLPLSQHAGPQSVAIGDLNRDGKPDLAVANFSGSVSVLLAGKEGGFLPAVDYPAGGSGCYSIAIGNLTNMDKIPYLAVVSGNYNTVSVLPGNVNVDGTFQSAQSYSVGQSPNGVAIGDVNGDGIPDLAVANSGDNYVSVLLGISDDTNLMFGTANNFDLGVGDKQATAVVIKDLNGDGKLDLAIAGEIVSVLLNTSD